MTQRRNQAKAVATAFAIVEVKKVEAELETQKAEAEPWDADGPLPAPFEFKVTVEKTTGCSILGFELDLLDGQRAQVCSVKPGVIQNYNETVDEKFKIQSRDWVLEVNGVSGNVQDMYKKLKGDAYVSLLLRRTATFVVNVRQKEKDGSLGLSVKRAAAGVSLLLLEVHDVFKEWNAQHPRRAVKKFDRIMEVNGVSSNTSQMVEELQSASMLKLLFMRPDPIP